MNGVSSKKLHRHSFQIDGPAGMKPMPGVLLPVAMQSQVTYGTMGNVDPDSGHILGENQT